MIRLKDAEKTYENGTKAVRGISFQIDDGEFVFLVGPSGSGKSTIIKMLTGEIVPTGGRVMVNGFSMSRIKEKQLPLMRRTIGVIFQDFRLIASRTVFDNLALAMRAVGASPREIRSRIPYVLELVGLAGAIPAGLCGILGSPLFHSMNNMKTAPRPPHEVGCHNQRKQPAQREIFREARS